MNTRHANMLMGLGVLSQEERGQVDAALATARGHVGEALNIIEQSSGLDATGREVNSARASEISNALDALHIATESDDTDDFDAVFNELRDLGSRAEGLHVEMQGRQAQQYRTRRAIAIGAGILGVGLVGWLWLAEGRA